MRLTIMVYILFFSILGISQDKTNIVLFVVDDLGSFDMSYTGSKLFETPHIDRLASEGILFDNAYVAHPRCVPSRYALFTGKFPARAGIPGGKEQMKVSEITVGEVFQEEGYKTFFAGKWHLGKREKQWPQNQGFDINKGGCSAGAPISYFYPYNDNKGNNTGNKKEIVGLDEGQEGEYITDRLTDETINFIKNNKEEPFFAVLSHYAVHTPFQAKQEMIKKYKKKLKKLSFKGPAYMAKDGTTKMHQDNAVYAAMVESMDDSLGKLIKTLKDEGIYHKTAIVFTSDHGGLSNRGLENNRSLATSNLPLRAGKGHCYEGGIKVPFIIYWPGKTKPGSSSQQITINTDIFPTLLDLAGISLRPTSHVDGISLKKTIVEDKETERTLFWHSPVGRPHSTGDENCSAIRVGNYKLIDFYDLKKIELYNLKEDPFETENIFESEKSISDRLHNKLLKWKDKIDAVHKIK